MTIQINKHRKIVEYVEKNFIFLDRRNIKTIRSSDKLDDKKLDSYRMLQRMNNFYRFELSEIMRIYDVFHCWLFRKDLRDSLESQINEFFDSVIVNENFEWEMNDILESRYRYNRFQYRVNWSDWSHDRTWYYVDNEEFDNVRDVMNDFHRTHFTTTNSKSFRTLISVFQIVVNESDFSTGRRRSRKKIAMLTLIEIIFN